jgi:hypothetical protein
MDYRYHAMLGMGKAMRTQYRYAMPLPAVTSHRGKLILAVIPAALFAGLFVLTPARTKSIPVAEPKPVTTYREQVHPDSFASRYGDETPVVKRVRTVAIVRDVMAIPPPVETVKPVVESPVLIEPKRSIRRGYRRVVRQASLDICTRHKMHKVYYRGGKTWRCRR